MATESVYTADDDTNPYIAMSDLAINLVLILAFFVAAVNALGRAGWEQVRYRDAQKAFRAAVRDEMVGVPGRLRPWENQGKYDPPGTQRWTFRARSLFKPGTAEFVEGADIRFSKFGKVLRAYMPQKGKDSSKKWRRIRIEGHTAPPATGEPDDWSTSSARAAAVAKFIQTRGHIPPHFLVVSSRAGQDPANKIVRHDPTNERVEIIVEYVQRK